MTPQKVQRSLTRRHVRLDIVSGPHRINVFDRPGLTLAKADRDALRARVSALALKVEPRFGSRSAMVRAGRTSDFRISRQPGRRPPQ